MVVAHEPGHVLREVLARLGGEVAEAAVDLDAYVAAEPFGVGRDGRVEERVEVLTSALQTQHPRHVVHAGAQEGDLLERHADVVAHLLTRVLDRVAETHDLGVRGAGVVGPTVHRHGVGVVEQPGMWAEFGHVRADGEQNGDRAQGAEDGAHPARVGDRLPQAVLLRDLEVRQGRFVHADLDHVDGEIGALESAAAIEMGFDLRRRAQLLVGPLGHRFGGGETLAVYVVQRDGGVGQLGEREYVAEQVACELDTAGADEDDPGHVTPPFLR